MNTMKSKDTVSRRELCTPAAELRIREAAEGEAPSRTITGYAILFGVKSEPLWSDEESEAREIIDPAAITAEVLDRQDIKFTMFHDRQLLLARSRNGAGTLRYSVDSKGVAFEFDAPATVDGDKALALVRSGDLSGCSFAFSTRYWDSDFVERTSNVVNGINHITYRVKAVVGVHDFTLTDNPAYTATSVEARELTEALKQPAIETPPHETSARVSEQVREMRRAAKAKLF